MSSPTRRPPFGTIICRQLLDNPVGEVSPSNPGQLNQHCDRNKTGWLVYVCLWLILATDPNNLQNCLVKIASLNHNPISGLLTAKSTHFCSLRRSKLILWTALDAADSAI